MKKKLIHDVFHEYISEFYQKRSIMEIKLIYEGEVTHKITKAFTASVENKMTNEGESSLLKRKVFHIIVESLQNISKHAQSIIHTKDDFNGMGSFLIAKSKKDYYIVAGNPIHKDEKQEIIKLIDNINSLNKQDLSALHKEQMKEGKLSSKGGAGLGLIEIARKSGKALSYSFKKLSDEVEFFILTTQIPSI
ncbi:MAG: hypothetical protein B6I18_07455 [Bacteroidetes bacterium 4572_112]|nr:MAG: hypothetical protein B6I18_07455 [Bacteroidetes bacterium 4572_112]